MTENNDGVQYKKSMLSLQNIKEKHEEQEYTTKMVNCIKLKKLSCCTATYFVYRAGQKI